MNTEEEEDNFLNIDEFIKLDKISRGGAGEVYITVNKNRPDVKLAAKIMISDLFYCNKEEKISIKREIDALSQLDHPYIVKFIGYSPIDFDHEPHPVIVTEYLPNGSLYDIIQKDKMNAVPQFLTETKKLINIFGIASIMSYLHTNNFLHRDLKPENVLVDDFLFPKIADFGLAKNMNSNSIRSKSEIKGTPPFLAPEILDDCEYSKASDVYAYAFTIYQIVTFQNAYKTNDFQKVFASVRNNKRPEFDSDVPECFVDLISKCWSQNPKERPTFDEIVHLIKTDKSFTEKVDKTEFFYFVNLVENKGRPIDPKKKFKKISLNKNFSSDLQICDLPHVIKQVFKLNCGKLIDDVLIFSDQDSTVLFANRYFYHEGFINAFKSFSTVIFELNDNNESFESIFQKISGIYESYGKNIVVKMVVTDKWKTSNCIQNKKVPISIIIDPSVEIIKAESFNDCISVYEIKIPSSIKIIKNKAFCNCRSLTKIQIPSTVTRIGKNAFSKCISLEEIEILSKEIKKIKRFCFSKCSSLKKFSVPESVEEIQGNSFCECSSLEEINIPTTVKYINNGAFSGCKSLKSILIPPLLTSINEAVFVGCFSLEEIMIPSSIKIIESAAFNTCTSLKKVNFENESTLETIRDKAFGVCISLEEITIPHSVKTIDEYCFNGCLNLKRITITSLKNVSESVFSGCISLEQFIIPYPTSFIERESFYNCIKLNKIKIPKSVTTIGYSSFSLCSSLNSLTIPDSVTSIGSYAFNKCTSLSNISIPSSVNTIGQYAFRGCINLKTIEIDSSSIEKIEDSIFEGCSLLKEITIPRSVKEIGKCSFQGCSSLEKVTFCLPSILSTIDEYAFCSCSSLNKLCIPSSIRKMGIDVFRGCNSLMEITIPSIMINTKHLSLNEKTKIKRFTKL